jgi:hypothetical protein
VGILPTMAFLTAHRSGAWELRESAATPAGPRSRTLASFHVLTQEALAHAQARTSKALDAAALRRAARRLGAPVAPPAADAAAAGLLAELAEGRTPRAALGRLLRNALGDVDGATTDAARAAAAWVAATPQRRADALTDLLLLADHLPAPRVTDRPRFPRLESRPA